VPAIVIPLACYNVSAALVFPNAFSEAFEPFPDIAGIASALFTFLQILGGVLMSSIMSASPDVNQLPLALVFTGIGVWVLFMNFWRKKYWQLLFQKKEGLRELGSSLKKQIKWNDLFWPWNWKTEKTIYRYYHAFRKSELRKELQASGFLVEENVWYSNGLKMGPSGERTANDEKVAIFQNVIRL